MSTIISSVARVSDAALDQARVGDTGNFDERRISRALPTKFRGAKAVEIRAEGDTPKTISGYGAVFYNASDPGTEYEMYDGYFERIMPGCFDRAIREDDVRSMFNHDSNQLLGRRAFRADDTLALSIDATGLRYDVQIDMTDPTHQALVPKLRSGKVDGASFMFQVTARTWREETRGDKSVDIVEINEVRLWEVGPVVFPAYESATSEARSAERRAIEEDRKQRRNGDLRAKTLALRMQFGMLSAGI